MNEPLILEQLRQELIDAVPSVAVPPNPLAISPWIAMSLLQKSVRRGRMDLALGAAATLLATAPDKLWRRLGSIAFEDVGLADLDAVVAATAALGGKRYRALAGGEWNVASYIVELLCSAPKSRAADDLLMLAELHPSYSVARTELAGYDDEELVSLIGGQEPLPVQAIALWYAIGTDRRPSDHLGLRRGNPGAAFNQLFELGCSLTLLHVCREGFAKLREVLCPFVGLLSLQPRAECTTADDDLPPERMIRSIPGWALDVYSREGKAALRSFLAGRSEAARMAHSLLAREDQLAAIGHAVFRVEGGLVQKRLCWSIGDELKAKMDRESFQALDDASPFVASVRADIPALNEVRDAHF